jgi:hypothetical protein
MDSYYEEDEVLNPEMDENSLEQEENQEEMDQMDEVNDEMEGMKDEEDESKSLDELNLDELLAELELEETKSEEDEALYETKEEEDETKKMDEAKKEEGEEEEEEEEEEAGEKAGEEDEEIDLENMTEEDLKHFIEDVIEDMISSGEIEKGHEGEEGAEGEEAAEMGAGEEELDLDEILAEFKSEEDETKKMDEAKEEEMDETKKMKDELDEAHEAIKTLRSELNEINLLNAKLLYTNKIFKAKTLTESQKVKVLAAFDKATTKKEAQLVYETLLGGLKEKSPIKENLGRASKPAGVAAVKKPIVESNDMVRRFQKLAGII